MAVLYAYRCRRCDASSEYFRDPVNRDNPAYCTDCSAWSARRAPSPPGLVGDTVVREQR